MPETHQTPVRTNVTSFTVSVISDHATGSRITDSTISEHLNIQTEISHGKSFAAC
jgi:hypothetical protein